MKKQSQERSEDAALLALKMGDGATSQGMQIAFNNLKKARKLILLKPPILKAWPTAQHLDFSPRRGF